MAIMRTHLRVALKFREAWLEDLWRDRHPGKPIPTEVGRLRSWECVLGSRKVGHCTGDSTTGEIIGLAVVAAYQGQGIGRRLISLVVDALQGAGAKRRSRHPPIGRCVPTAFIVP